MRSAETPVTLARCVKISSAIGSGNISCIRACALKCLFELVVSIVINELCNARSSLFALDLLAFFFGGMVCAQMDPDDGRPC